MARKSLILATAVLAAFATGDRAESLNNPDTFVYAITGDIDSLDPHWEYDAVSQEVQLQLYEGLRYAFPIRKDVRFHDGTPLSPEDVKYSLLRFMFTDRASGPSFLLLGPLLGVDSLEGVEGPKAAALFEEAQRAVTIEAGALVLKLRRPYGTGAFMLERWEKENKQLSLVRNE